jgi:hypothetical protein
MQSVYLFKEHIVLVRKRIEGTPERT